MALDMLCQEFNGFWQLVRRCQNALPFSHRGLGCDKNGEGCGERMKEKERERRALLSWLRWPVSFESFVVRHGVLLERMFSFLSLCHRVVFTVLGEFSMRWF